MKSLFVSLTLTVLSMLLALATLALSLWWSWSELLEATFRYPYALWLLLTLPLVFWRETFGRDRRLPRLRVGSTLSLQAGPRGLRSRLRHLPGALRCGAFVLLVLALARPVNLVTPQVAERQGIDIIVVLDLSGSMRAVLDNLPRSLRRFLPSERRRGVRPTRLDGAKAVIRDFIERRKTDRIGVVVFGKKPFVLSPPTLDYRLLDKLVAGMTLDRVDGSATAIGDAVGVGVARVRHSPAKSKAIILLTDGDNNAGRIEPMYAAELAQKVGAKVFSIQIGDGELAQVQQGFFFGQPQYRTVPFPTNPELLKKLAKKTGGSFYAADDATKLQASFHDVLDKLEKSKLEAVQADFQDLYWLFLLPGAVWLALDALLRAWPMRRFP